MTTLDDFNLLTPRLLELEDAEKLQLFFADLRYNTDIPGAVEFNLTGELQNKVTQVRRLAVDPLDEDIEVYLFEMLNVNMSLIQQVVRLFQKRNGRFIVVFADQKWDELEFVLLDREKRQTTKPLIGQVYNYALRPRFLSLNRKLQPKTAELRLATRILKRFTITEPDAPTQWDKLRSAYSVAEWSEADFNNRKLFSDYYLSHRLTAEEIWSSDDTFNAIQAASSDIRALLINAHETARARHAKKDSETANPSRDDITLPLLHRLGFRVEAAPGDESAQVLLYGTESAPLAQALVYDWNRNLDDRDINRDQRTPDDIPGAKVVSLLEKAATDWVIVTNGKLWRLYSTTTSNRATNYYEVDLEEALNAPDPAHIQALKYWWLMFRPDAFRGLLDTILAGSEEYARGIRESLKDRIFTEIFPEFARGFIAQMRAQKVSEAQIEARLGEVFNGTMTFLYRLMFILYAESLELLPLTEIGYSEYSLRKMKKAIADVAGPIRDHAPKLIANKYAASSTKLYDRLKTLFAAINGGNEDLNLPEYNGGLFNPDTESGQFLETYAVPDRFLALGLDLLVRDYDTRTRHELVMIDFKSLDVRHLGSVYEGLLEFKLSIAREHLAIVKEKNREVYTPFDALKGERKKVAVEKGDVYLENDKRERKATGSYYTPGYIVKYIVEHTVGPVLTRKLEALAPRLHTAQKDYRARKKYFDSQKHGETFEDPEKFWTTPDMLALADECLDMKVLDPAMGSGHFLVQVVDFISVRLLAFLEAWGENPVWAMLERTRRDIRDDLIRQGVTLDTDKLTRVNLLKRAVLKRCVYGVDLNPMAVELAKVSLWLDAFTVGAPLSFLDHHLKCGNSLIGATDLTEVVGVGTKRWELILDAAAEMVEVSKSTDSTIGQVGQSKKDYAQAQAKLEDVKKYANVAIASYFVDKLIEYRKSKTKYSAITQISMIAYGSHQGQELQALFERAQAAASEKRFFHWRLEFPEVFVDLEARDWAKGGGFDAVVGNPPYIRVQGLAGSDVGYFSQNFKAAQKNYDVYALFVDRALQIINSLGLNGVILPHKFFQAEYGEGLRQLIADGSHLKEIIDFGEQQIFEGATTYVCIMIIAQYPQTTFRYAEVKDLLLWQKGFGIIEDNISAKALTKNEWNFVVGPSSPIFHKLNNLNLSLGDVAELFVGAQTDGDDIFIVESVKQEEDIETCFSNETETTHPFELQHLKPLLKGSLNIKRYTIADSGKRLIFPYQNIEDKSYLIPEKQYQQQYPLTWKYLALNESRLRSRNKGNMGSGWYGYVYKKNHTKFSSPKIIVPAIAEGSCFAYDETGEYFFVGSGGGGGGAYGIRLNESIYSYYCILSILNSQLTTFYLKSISTSFRGGYIALNRQYIERIPLRRIDFTTPTAQREAHAAQFAALYTQGDYDNALTALTLRLSHNESDVAHDALAFLAEQMIDLNTRKQTEVKRFLAWLEAKLKIKPKKDAAGLDSLSGKTKLYNYLGDYQKGQPTTPFREIWAMLDDNRGRFHVLLADVRAEIEAAYDASLRVLLPLKNQLKRTDLLIDQIVYKLYGLTDEEIALIERPQKEQALEEALAAVAPAVLEDTENPDAARVQVAEAYEPAALRFVALSPSQQAQDALDRDYPAWRSLPADMQGLLEDAERDTLDGTRRSYNGPIIAYASVAERMINEKIFVPFRQAGFTAADVVNERAFKPFMQGGKPPMLGGFRYLFNPKKGDEERAFKTFVQRLYADADARIFDDKTGLVAYLHPRYIDPRNDAGHANRVCVQADAQDAREWTLNVLKLL